MSLMAAFSVVIQVAMPALTILPQLSPVVAQEVTDPTPTVEPTQETTPTPETTIAPTPTVEATPTVTVIPSDTVTPTPTPGSEQPQDTNNEQPQNNGPPEQGQIGADGASTESASVNEETTPVADPSASLATPVEKVYAAKGEQFSDSTDEYWSIDLENGTSETKGKVQLGVKYIFPQENNVTVSFTALPKNENLRANLKIQKVKISDLNLPNDVKPYGEYAYDITTGMADDNFEYDVTLPKPDEEIAEVVYMEDKNSNVQTVSEEKTTQEGNKIQANNLDHFTIFVVTSSGNGPVLTTAFVNNQTQVTVSPGDSITATIKVTTSGSNNSDDWRSSEYRIDNGSWVCIDTPDYASDITNQAASFNLTAPVSTGTYDISFRAYNLAGCDDAGNGNPSDTVTLQDAIIVQTPNPTLTNSCGIDVGLVVDTSTSIDSGELSTMKTALKDFVNAFVGTPTEVAVVSFDDEANVESGFTSNLSSLTAASGVIDDIDGSGFTNWEDAMHDTRMLFPNRATKPDLIVFTTDGDPTDSSAGSADTNQPNDHLDPAIVEANLAKAAGIRIITLGIGLSGAASQTRLEQISSAGAVYNADNFDDLAETLEDLVNDLCGGTITARKMIGQNPAANWNFTINGQQYTTDANGYTQSVSVPPGTYSVTETQQTGYSMTSASCTGASNNGTQGVNSVTGVQVAADNIVSCTFTNTLSAFCGDGIKNGAEQCDGSDLGGLSSSVFSCSNQCTLNLVDPKVTICHATDSHTNPYNTNQPNKSADVSGHDGHNGPIWFPGITQTWGDIIPPFDYVGGSYPGKNWTTEGQAIYNSQCTMAPGTLVVQKTTLPAADQTSFAITATGSGTITGGGAGTVTDANDQSYTVTPGIYSVTEDVPTGWTQVSNTCSNVSVATGETKTCLITNGKLPTITVNKVVTNDDGGQKEIEDFSLFINATPTNSGDTKLVPPGTYTISETADSGYVGTISGDCAVNGSVTVAYGDAKVCTITNDDIPGSLTVHKLVDRDGNGTFEDADPSDFTWTIDGSGSYVMGTTNADVAIGMRNIGENSPEGYHFVSWYPTGSVDNEQNPYSCTNPQSTTLPIAVNVGPGGSSDYTLCNARDMGTVTFEKLVVGGNASPSAWTFTVASVSGEFHSGESITLPTGTYTVTESGGDSNYSATSATGICSALQNQTANLTVTTEGGTCTFTNTHDTGSVKVNKRTDKNGDGDYIDSGEGVNGSASNAFTWSLDGSGSNVMGTTVSDVLTGNHDVNENTVADYHVVGWFTNGGQYSCTNPEGTTLPATVAVTKGNTAEITLCNARDAGTVTVIKNAINNSENNFGFDTNLPGGDFELEDDGNDNNGGTEESKTVIAATGQYTIRENNESGWKLTNLVCNDENGSVDLDTRTATVNVSTGEDITCTFTNTQLAKVWGFKFYDKNGNAIWNLLQGELGLGNWRIFIDEDEDQAYDVGESTKLTSNFFLTRGYYEFTNLLPGTYTICEELQTGWNNTLPLCQTVELSPGEIDHFVDFGNIDVGDITVTKYNDENGNGTRDEGEEVLSGWEINLTGEDSQTTGEQGTVLFANLPEGTYGLSETMQPQWRQTNISCSNDPEVTPTPSPTPGDEEETGGTCHFDEGKNTYSAINVPITNPGHADHEEDFEYEGEYDITGQEGQLADEWCNENAPEQEVDVRQDSFLGVSKVHAQRTSETDDETHPVTVEAGQHVTCEIGNQVVNPELTITKSNNTGGADMSPGDQVQFTLTVTASDSAVLGVEVEDLPSLGFKYTPGSWTATSSVRGDIKASLVTTEPTYASPGTWQLGDMIAGEIVTLTYLADIASDIQSGLYRDLAWSEGEDLLSSEVVANDDTGVFVGTEVNVIRNDVEGASTNVVREEGSVLGASTELPSTGGSIFWIALAGILTLAGVTSITLGAAMTGKTKKSKKRN
jgi:uncharacterized protein YegL